jgi:hypothetical protein
MNDQHLDSALEEKARALCAQITVAHDLDSEIQEELYGHIEDKILGYLSGEVPVTGDDALILVREHFGDARVIKSLLQDVHASEVALSQNRRYIAAAVATLCCFISGKALYALLGIARAYYGITSGSWSPDVAAASSFLPIHEVSLLAMMLVTFLAPLLILVRWQKALRAGSRPWFYRWGYGRLALLLLALLTFNLLMPKSYISLGPGLPDHGIFSLIDALLGMTLVCIVLGNCIIWIRWCDVAPRTKRNLWNVAGAWCLGYMILTSLPSVYVNVETTLEEAEKSPYRSTLVQAPFFDTAAYWNVSLRNPVGNSMGMSDRGSMLANISFKTGHFLSGWLMTTFILGGTLICIYRIGLRVCSRRRGKGFDDDLSVS